MNLVDVVSFFRTGGTYSSFCSKYGLNKDAEAIEFYMEKPFGLDKDVVFFEIEETKGRTCYKFNDVEYHNLFDIYYFLDVIEESMNEENISISDEALGKKLLDYVINDA